MWPGSSETVYRKSSASRAARGSDHTALDNKRLFCRVLASARVAASCPFLTICDDVLHLLGVLLVDEGDMDASLPSTVPRLRISRFSPRSQYDTLTPVAGPSHNSDSLHADDDDEDAESTPRMSTSAIPDRRSPRTGTTPGLPVDTPAERLRNLLARVPNTPDSVTPHARPPMLPANSEPDSDFEPPYSTAATPSIARESLKELFSRALREPGNTPRKGKQRRNSIDASEVESSPRVEEERAKYRWKRRSLSDEEAEKSSEYSLTALSSPRTAS